MRIKLLYAKFVCRENDAYVLAGALVLAYFIRSGLDWEGDEKGREEGQGGILAGI